MALPPDDKKKAADTPKAVPPSASTTPPPLNKSPAYSEARKAAIAQAAERQKAKDTNLGAAAPASTSASSSATAKQTSGSNTQSSVTASSSKAADAGQTDTKSGNTVSSQTNITQQRGEYPEIKGNSGKASSTSAAPVQSTADTAGKSGDNTDSGTNPKPKTLTTKAEAVTDTETVTTRTDAPRRRPAGPPGSERGSVRSPDRRPMRERSRSEADAGYRRGPPPGRRSPPPDYRPARAPVRPRRKMGPPPGSSRRGAIVRRGRPVPQHRIHPSTPYDGSPWGPLLIGLFLLAGVAWYAVEHYTPQIESDLARRSNEALAGEGLVDASVTIDGRTAVLSGSVDDTDQKELAEQTVAGTFGVRAVDNQLTVGTGGGVAVEPRAQPSFSLSKSGDSIELTGTVSDTRYATAMEDAAKTHFGADRVNASISVEPGTTNPGWMSAVNQLIPELDKVENGALSIDNDTLTLTGASDAETKQQIGTLATALTDGQLTVENLIEAPEPAVEPEPVAEPEPVVEPEPEPVAEPENPKLPAFAAIRESGDGITVNGFMSAEGAEQVLRTLGSDKTITNNISIDDRAETPNWTLQLGNSLDALTSSGVANPGVTMTRAGSVRLRGVVESDNAKAVASEAVAGVYEDQYDIVNDISVVIPPPVPTLSPFASLKAADNTVTITGLLPPATAKSISSSYRAAGKSVIENVTRDERVIAPEWTDAFTQAADSLAGVKDQAIIVNSSGEVIIKGTVEEDSTRQAAAENIASLFGDSVSLRNDIQVTPTIVPADELAKLFDAIDLSGIRFATNSAELTDSSAGILDQIVDALTAIPDVPVEISGHTDSAGSYDYNLSLSAQRAETVTNYLTNRGIDGDRLESTGFGPSRPVASNDTRAGRALNRRIEFKISGE